ncbi:MAG: hypothetical protein KAI45_05235, partial [Melioribacteraceae bacterium]|nr:hypothetical protein [Melioribacteraceae bacterium]
MKQKNIESVSVYKTFKILFVVFILVPLNMLFAQSNLIVIPTKIISENQEEKGLLLQDSLETSLNKKSARTVIPILSLPKDESPEGIAVDNLGNIYISNTKGENGSINEILLVGLNGSYTVFATLPGKGRALGLATDQEGSVYVAFKTEYPNTNGVYRIGSNGIPVHLAGSEQMGSPNSLTFDDLGNLYVTDSYKGKDFEGSVWCYNKMEQVFKLFIKDTLLDGGVPPVGPTFPLPGANGIAFYPPNKLYVANTKESSIIRITIGEFGNEPTIELVKKDSLLLNIDGIVVDKHENIYGVLPPSTLGALGAPPVPPLVK